MAWTPEGKALAIEMALAGQSTKVIMEATGFTKGQVVGFVGRAGINMTSIKRAKLNPLSAQLDSHKPSGFLAIREPRVRLKPLPIRLTRQIERYEETRKGSEKPVTLMELTRDHCRAIEEEGFYCGKVTIIKNKRLQSYCQYHYSRYYRAPRKGE